MSGRQKSSLVVTLVVLAAARAAAGAPDGRDRTVTATRVVRGPHIDGHLDDRAWLGLSPDRGFTQNFPEEGRPPSEATELYLVYDDEALYVGLRCHDRHPERIIEALTRRDRDNAADKVTVDIDSRHDHGSAYHFEVNVSGVLADGLRFNDFELNTDWDGLWNAATSRDPGGWTAELEIPWRTLRFDGKSPVMGFQVRRHLAARQEIDELAAIPRTQRGEVSRYGSLLGVSGIGPRRLIQIQPYVALGINLRRDSTSHFDDGASLAGNAGLDAKIGLSSSLTLDATINPDFGQVEADQVVLNLTTFEVFYPEKRPFFLEGVELFATPIQQFYTRRIGRPPSPWNAGSTLGTADVAIDTPLSGRIYGAAKLSGQIVPHLSIAAIDAVTAEQTVSVMRPLPFGGERRLLDPLANFAVLRLRSEWGASYFGVMVTAVNRFERSDYAAPRPALDFCPGDEAVRSAGGRCTRDAYTASADARLLTRDGAWGVHAQVIGSLVEHGAARMQPDGVVIGPGATGGGVKVQGGKIGGDNLLVDLRYEGYTPRLELSDAGYLRSANQHYLGVSGALRTLRPIGRALESRWEVFNWNRLSWDGAVIEQGLGTGPMVRTRSFWQVWAGGGWNFDRWDNRETRDGALTRRLGGFWAELWVKSDPRRRLTGELNLHVNRVQHGYNSNGDLTIGVRPVPQVDLSIIPRFNYTYGDPRWAETSADGGHFFFGDLESKSFDVTVRGTYTFTPRLSLQLYAQAFVAGGHYTNWVQSAADRPVACPDPPVGCPRAGTRLPLSSFVATPSRGSAFDFSSGQINLNAVLRWEYLPGSTLIAVYTRAQSQPTFSPGPDVLGTPELARFRGGPTVDSVLVKLSYLWR